jgi:hypothetical protein
MGPDLLEQIPPLLDRQILDQMLFGRGQHALQADHQEITEQMEIQPSRVARSTVIREVLVQETSTPVAEALTSALHLRTSAVRSSMPVSDPAKSETRTELLTDIAATHFVLRTKEGDVLVPISDIKRLTLGNGAKDSTDVRGIPSPELGQMVSPLREASGG